jgi:preprotein translocase subunit SecF
MPETPAPSDLAQPATTVPAPGERKTGHSAGFITRLITGTGAFNILGHRKAYYLTSAILVVVSLIIIVVRNFNFGIDFAGGTRLTLPSNASITTEEVAGVVERTTGVTDVTVQTVGTGASATLQVRTATLTADQIVQVKQAISTQFAVPLEQVSDSAVSETWGGEISRQATIALVVFLIAVSLFLWIRYEKRVAVGALTAVMHDLVITAGVYSLIGFEVTPATVIGLLAILGFSLYDTVVVYDKVQENTKGLTSLLRRTFREAANLAVNQTIMRSINTTVIALLPVAGLLVAGVAILGSGTLKDLALVQLIGMLVSGYSSVFLAVPIAVDLRERDSVIAAHTARVLAKRKAEGLLVDADGDPIGRMPGYKAPVPVSDAHGRAATTSTPRPGVKPQRTGGARPTGKAGRPTGKRPH